MPKHDIEMGLLLTACAIAIFLLGRSSHSAIDMIKLPDNSRYEKSIDSLTIINKELEGNNKRMLVTLDSLKLIKSINKIKYIHATNQIKNFTPTTRHNFNDSILKVAGLK